MNQECWKMYEKLNWFCSVRVLNMKNRTKAENMNDSRSQKAYFINPYF